MGGFGLPFYQLDAAIGQFEGFGLPNSLATVNNNPGNMIYGPFAINHGSNGVNNGFATFPDQQTGFAATDALVGYYANHGATLESLVNSWAPPGADNPNNSNYIDFLSRSTGLPPSSSIAQLTSPSFAPGSSTSVLGQTLGTGLGGGILGGVLNGLGAATGLPLGSSQFGNFLPSLGFSWARVATFLVGLILVAAGLFMFKPVQETIVLPAVKSAKAAATEAAAA